MRHLVLNSSSNSMLKTYTVNLNEKAKKNKIDPAVGRENEILQMSSILLKRTKNNPILIGEAGVGKTAIAEEFARRIVRKEVHDDLLDKEIYTLDISGLIAGTKERGAFEEKVTDLFKEIDELDNVVLFIDEIHTVVGKNMTNDNDSGNLNIANLLKPKLSRGEITCIGATTIDEYNKYFIRDKAMDRRFRPIYIVEPSYNDTLHIMKSIKYLYEEFHNCTISDELIEYCVALSDRFIHYRNFPDKSIDLLDESCSKLKLNHLTNKRTDTVLKKEDIENVLQLIYDITFDMTDENNKLKKLEIDMNNSIVGHEGIKKSLVSKLKRYKCGFHSNDRPIASFLFIGPTGVGKTEMANVLSESYYGGKENIIRLDMSEYMEQNTVSKLIGSPPGYVGFEEGGYLTKAIKNNPYSVVLFDEIEKAHYKVFDIFLQILEYGEITDAYGKRYSFKNSIIVMTSNVGNTINNNSIGFQTNNTYDHDYQIRTRTIQCLKEVFKPEFLNRIDDILHFDSLSIEQLSLITDNMLVSEIDRISTKLDMNIIISKKTKREIKDQVTPSSGARNIRTLIQTNVTDRLSNIMLQKKYKSKSIVI